MEWDAKYTDNDAKNVFAVLITGLCQDWLKAKRKKKADNYCPSTVQTKYIFF